MTVATTLDRLFHSQQKFECSGRIIEVDVSMDDVLAACGSPAWREKRDDSRFVGQRPDGTILVTVATEEWIYDFGPDRLLHFLGFRENKVVAVNTGSYGSRNGDCAGGANLAVGDSKFETLRKCGLPTSIRTLRGELTDLNEPAGYEAMKDSDYWTYDFGADRFVRQLTFGNGRLRKIETGGYGR